MTWYLWMVLAAFVLCVVLFSTKFIRLIRLGAPKDLSKPSGNIKDGVIYSCTTAMMPKNKESAYMHLPTYAAGIVYHLGTFASLALFVWIFIAYILKIYVPETNLQSLPAFLNVGHIVVACCLVVSSLCGLAVLIKRFFSAELKSFSSFDDYFSNLITTLMQIATALFLFMPEMSMFYFFVMTILFIWMPFGKMKHLLYFFAARYHLGFFYGRRGSWPPAKV